MARFGAYEILHELKTGGMGEVLLGRRRGPGAFEQLVAIKTIRPEYGQIEAVRAMFLDEAAILARINHPGIATVHDFGEEAGTLYMVMEYVAGISFRGLSDLAMPPAVAARAIAEACRGLHAAHEVHDNAGNLLGVVHRDISPDNLMLGFDGHVKVIDFGIALVKNRQAPVTEFGTVKGKPPYMSPEQVKNETLDRRSDVFSLGVVFHELLTGEPLFDGDSIYAVARAVEHQELVPPSQVLGRALPEGLDAAVMSALERDLTRRAPTAAALAEQLEQVINLAGDQTLEAWAARELAAPRDAHRRWITSVVAGHEVPPPVGRATGSVTPVAPMSGGPASPARPVDEPPPNASTHLSAATDDDRSPARRRSVVPLALGLLVLLALGGAMAYLMRSRPITLSIDAARSLDASVAADSAMVVLVPLLDAAPPSDAPDPPDAAVRDAGHSVARDAQKSPPRDAAVIVAQSSDAAEAPKGSGMLIVKHYFKSPSYLEVYVDGRRFGKTPLVRAKPIDAGTHVVTLLTPNSDEVVYKTTIHVADGEVVTVQQPAPP